MKTHKYAVMTGALKNLFGLLPDPMRILYHWALDEVIAALTDIWFGRMAVVMDGIVAMEGDGPIYGRPVQMGLLLCSRNPIALDTVAARLMGIDPARVRHIGLAAERCGWSGDICVDGLPAEEVARSFARAGQRWFVRFEGWLMRHPTAVRIIFSDPFRRYISRPFRALLTRLRGGSYSWYDGRDQR